jgi:purine-nucleoside phosphorylase
MAAGTIDREIDHAEVMQTGERVKSQFVTLLRAVIPRLAGDVK